MPSTLALVGSVVTCTLGLTSARYLYLRYTGQDRYSKLPPGPQALPFLGNVLDLPTKNEWEAYARLRLLYGDIVTFLIFTKPIIFLNSAKTIADLFGKRSAIYSSRPNLVMAGELMGWEDSLVLSPYGDRWKNYRRLLKMGLNTKALGEYARLMENAMPSYLQTIIDSPNAFQYSFRRTAGIVALNLAYGYDGTSDGYALLSVTEAAMEMFSISALPNIFLVDTLPFLKYVPAWFPFAGFQRLAARTRKLITKMVTEPYERVAENLRTGQGNASFTASLIEMEGDGNAEGIKWVSAALYGGQADTVGDTTMVTAMANFFLCMMLFPEVQKKAQAEIDSIVGHDRLVCLDDKSSLPYVNSVLKELLRWCPVTRMVSHMVTQDDIYEGYFIPAGTALVANIWAVLHDETMYTKPKEFRPERFLPPENAPDSANFAFGFGRRECPGVELAQIALFLTMANVLAAFNIKKPVDSDGKVIEPTLDWSSGVTSHPHPYQCVTEVRHPNVPVLIRSWQGH
ncbi:cytochrome P450 [Boletus edulis BED1]|uniref:Cytochrome P450 n=1 Tax=Boletus edulis BED1 TaxID=1328754 RepID=A0AAD4BP49_BOLED|nr:cytochrome P450 [Boletus edulis BED1]